MRLRSHTRQGTASGSPSQGSPGTQATPDTCVTGSITDHAANLAGAVRNTRRTRQRQKTSGTLPTLPVELQEHILSYVDKSSWSALYRTSKQCHDWVATQAAAGWSKKVQTRLLLHWNCLWSRAQCFYTGSWHWMQHAHTPTYLKVQEDNEITRFLQGGNADASTLASMLHGSGRELQLHVLASDPARQPVYAQSWLGFFLNPQQATPAVTACFSHITTIRLQDVRLTHPLPECIQHACTHLRHYGLHNVEWPQGVQPGKPWPQLRHLAYGFSSSAPSATCITVELPQLLNPLTLPSLQGLYITSWPASVSVIPAVACCAAFRNQLTMLTLDTCSTLNTLSTVFSGPWTSCTPSTPNIPLLTQAEIHYYIEDNSLDALLAAAPALRDLRIEALQLSRSHAHIQCKVQQLRVVSMPDYVATLGRFPHMPELKQLSLPQYRVQGPGPSAQHVAAAVSAVERLGELQGSMYISFCKRGSIGATHMQTLGPLLQALAQKSFGTTVFCDDVDEAMLKALGAAALTSIAFSLCHWNSPHVLSKVWALMPHTNKVNLHPRSDKQQPSLGVDEALVLCRSATRPVTVCIPCISQEWQVVRDTLAAEGNQLVTILPAY